MRDQRQTLRITYTSGRVEHAVAQSLEEARKKEWKYRSLPTVILVEISAVKVRK